MHQAAYVYRSEGISSVEGVEEESGEFFILDRHRTILSCSRFRMRPRVAVLENFFHLPFCPSV